MPGYNPIGTYPFAVNFFVTVAQVWTVIQGKKLTYSFKLIFAFTSCGIIMIALPFLAKLPLGVNYWVIFVVFLYFGFCSGMVQGTVFTMAGSMPFKYIAAVMFGSGIVGLALAFLRAITLASFPVTGDGTSEKDKENEFHSALVFYGIAAVVMLACAVLQLMVQRNEYAIYYLDWTKNPRYQKASEVNNTEDTGEFNELKLMRKTSSIAVEPKVETWGTYLPAAKRNFMQTEGLLFSLLYIFLMTFVIFPNALASSYYGFLLGRNQELSWYYCINTTIFCIGDAIGRKLGGMPACNLQIKWVNINSLLRTIFLATTLLITFEVGPDWLFNSTWFKFLNLTLFALSNGFISTQCAVQAPSTVPFKMRAQVGSFIGVTITAGILLGSTLALALNPILAASPAKPT